MKTNKKIKNTRKAVKVFCSQVKKKIYNNEKQNRENLGNIVISYMFNGNVAIMQRNAGSNYTK